MSLLTALLHSYNYALEHDLVGKPDNYGTMILPMYYNSMTSNGKNIIEVLLSQDSELLQAYPLPKDQVIIFPVTEDSVARSSGVAPHPLVDSIPYVIQDGGKKSIAYMEQLESWLAYENNQYVRIIHDFLKRDDVYDQIVRKIQGQNEAKTEEENTGQSNNVDFKKAFMTFKIAKSGDKKEVAVSENKELQEAYRKFVEFQNHENPEKKQIICDLSGEEDYLCIKHRPLMATARLISQITANDENYWGRFSKADQSIRIGTETSQKIHLMAKYLLSGKNTSRWLGEQAYVVSWFSDDIQNNSECHTTKSVEVEKGKKEEKKKKYLSKEVQKNPKKEKIQYISDEETNEIVKSFTNGKILFSDKARYYIAVFDKISNGRVAAKYFKELNVSTLKRNLAQWQKKYHWFGYKKEKRNKELTPSPLRMVRAAYGVEIGDGQSAKLEVKKPSFLKTQYQAIVSAIVEGRDMPENIVAMLETNIRNRHRYKEMWTEVKFCALASLKEKEGIDSPMLDRENTDRSYLFGRLLALFERMEATTLDDDSERITNAEKMWTSYTNHPATIMMRLRNLIKPYEKKLKLDESKRGIYYKLIRDIEEVTNLLHEQYDIQSSEVNRPLDYGFIFGYEGQMRDIFTKKESEEDKDIVESEVTDD
ncbi:MAG: type I-C CRISPR-associated protein Cas8c/Csd1 [Firmicutes bacterium]|nr:type I-C CRISPR-associated protein Cas8c/Csd1 [Bacillota bacterium]